MNPIYTSELLKDDNIDELINKYKKLSDTFTSSIQEMKSQAVLLDGTISKSNVTTTMQQDSVKKTATEIEKLTASYIKVKTELEAVNAKLKALTEAKKANNAVSKAESKVNDTVSGSLNNLKAQLVLNKTKLNEMTEAQKKNSEEGYKLQQQTDRLSVKIARLSKEETENIKIKKLQANAASSAKGSFDQLSAQHQINTITLNRMSDAERKGTKAGRELEIQTKKIYEEMKNLQSATGPTSLNVGNYFESTFGKAAPILSNVKEQISGVMNSAKALFATPYGWILAVVAGLAAATKEWYNYNDSILEAKKITQDITGTTGEVAKEIRSQAIAISDGTGIEIKETLLAAKNAVVNFGIDYKTALDIIGVGLVDAGVKQDLFLESVSEYSVFFGQAGFSFQQFADILNSGIDLGIYQDKLPDALKEFTLSINEQTVASKVALENAFGKPFTETLLNGVKNGTITASEALGQISKEAEKVGINSQQAAQLTADLFRGAGEDAGGALNVFKAVNEALSDEPRLLNDIQKAQVETIRLNTELEESKARALETDGFLVFKQYFVNTWKEIQTVFYNVVEGLRIGITKFVDTTIINIAIAKAQWSSIPTAIGIVKDGFIKSFKDIGTAAGYLWESLKNLFTLNFDDAGDSFDKFKKAISESGNSISDARKKASEYYNNNVKEAEKSAKAEIEANRKVLLEQSKLAKEVENKVKTKSGTTVTTKSGTKTENKGKSSTELFDEEFKEKLSYLKEGTEKEMTALYFEYQVKARTTKDKAGLDKWYFNEYDKLLQKQKDKEKDGKQESIKKALDSYDLELQLKDTEFALLEKTEKEKTDFKIEQEKLRLKKILELNEQFGGDLSEIQKSIIQNQIKSLEQGSGTSEAKEKQSIYDLIGLDLSSEKQQALTDSLQYAKDQLNEWAKVRTEIAQQNVDTIKNEIDSIENRLQVEIENRNAGRAHNVETVTKELQDAKKAQETALRERKKAQQQQLLIESVQQASSLVTASAKIWGTLGFPFAIPALGLMWGSFIASKVQAANLTKKAYGDGGYEEFDYGDSHASGNDIQLGVTKDGKDRRVERGETMAIFNKRSVSKYGNAIKSIVSDINRGNLEKYIENQTRSGHIEVQNNIHKEIVPIFAPTNDMRNVESELIKIRKQNEVKGAVYFTDKNGNVIKQHKNLLTRYV
jgi:hypothetical protein